MTLDIPIELNTQQAQAYQEIMDFIFERGNSMHLLEGYAGTGKTYLVAKIIDEVLRRRDSWQIAITAPTNKAVKILRKSSTTDSGNVYFQTIHSLLGLREFITDSGDIIFVNSSGGDTNIMHMNLLIVDEVSMLSDDLFLKIDQYKSSIKILFCGDNAQIPPIMKKDCIPFLPERDQYNIRVSSLTEIMRQKKGNSIIETSFVVRENIDMREPPLKRMTELNEQDKGVVHVKSSDAIQREFFTNNILPLYFSTDFFKADSDYAKVISWTNKSVNQMNDLIRCMIYRGQKLSKIMPGEKLIANKPIIEFNKLGKTILFSSNDEFEVVDYEILTDSRFFFYYRTRVKYIDVDGSEEIKCINILHEDSEPEFKAKLAEIKRDAMKQTDPLKRRTEWRYFYDYLANYADIGYNYAITAHRAQGSTYKNVFVLEDDIDQNHKVHERNRIKYTAFTRPTDKLFIVKR